MNDARTKIVDDVTSLLSGVGIAAQGVREEVEQAIRARLDALMSDGAFVTREEFEVVREMVIAARQENAELRSQLDALQKKR
ncbi:accessory factor UbiK family protein [Alphaproteobacteria bacterium]|nr:accessory factor UbiK family protein [Alphaproteobacteria bacterium]